MEISRLYPQYNTSTNDRRKNSSPVAFERRSGLDRRLTDRISFDSKLNSDIQDVKNIFQPLKHSDDQKDEKPSDATVGAFCAIPYVRRFTGITDAVVNHEVFKAGGKTFLQAINVAEDWRDIKKVFTGSSMPNDYQVEFSFVRGTPLEKFEKIQKFGKKFDGTLYTTKFFQELLDKLGKKDLVYNYIEELDDLGNFKDFKKDKLGRTLTGIKIEGSLLSKIVGRAAMRIPLIGVAFLGLLEVPSIITAKDHLKQAVKSTISVTSVITSGAILGAIGAFAGPLGSLAGLGVGSYLGAKLASKVNSAID